MSSSSVPPYRFVPLVVLDGMSSTSASASLVAEVGADNILEMTKHFYKKCEKDKHIDKVGKKRGREDSSTHNHTNQHTPSLANAQSSIRVNA